MKTDSGVRGRKRWSEEDRGREIERETDRQGVRDRVIERYVYNVYIKIDQRVWVV